MRVFSTRRWVVRAALCVAALAVAALSSPTPAVAQFGGGGGGGGMGGGPGGGMPASMFGEKRKARDDEARGPSMSATDEPVAEIRIVGNKTIPTDQILNQLQTRVGRPFDPALVQRDVRKLYSRSWFLDVQPSYDKTAAGRVVIFKVIERPVIRYIQYLGNEGIRDKKLAKETGLKVGGSLDPEAVQEARRKIIDLYHRTGYNNVQVAHSRRCQADRPRHRVRHPRRHVPEDLGSQLRRQRIRQRPPAQNTDRIQAAADVALQGLRRSRTAGRRRDKLTAYYRAFGYFEAKIGEPIIEFDEKNKWVTVTFVIHEGPRYDVRGSPVHRQQDLRQYVAGDGAEAALRPAVRAGQDERRRGAAQGNLRQPGLCLCRHPGRADLPRGAGQARS